MDMRPAQIELSIDELIIDEAVIGRTSPRALQALRADVERELFRLLSAGELPPNLRQAGQIEQLAGSPDSAGRSGRGAGSGQTLGATIAQSVYRSLRE
ncbi:MAG: hypothetical protein R6W76_07680 [Caldilinea sp.]